MFLSSAQDACSKQMDALQSHVQEFVTALRPELQKKSYMWLTHVTDIEPLSMTKNIMHALRWGKRDVSHGLLFTKPSLRGLSLLLWSGASAESREKWCKSMGMFMQLGGVTTCQWLATSLLLLHTVQTLHCSGKQEC